MLNEARAGTVLILPPSPWSKMPPTLMVGRIWRPSGVVNTRCDSTVLCASRERTKADIFSSALMPMSGREP